MLRSIDKTEVLKRIDSVLKNVDDESNKVANEYTDATSAGSFVSLVLAPQLCLRLKQTLLDLSPRGSGYWNYAHSFSDNLTYESMRHLYGALKGLREDYVNDFLSDLNEILDAELFADILEQAEYLLSQGYFRASAVVAGVALESHLRKLAEKNSIPITTDEGKYIKAESLNGDLLKNTVIDKTMHKSVTSWLGLRNDAAHPDKKEINEGLLEPMIAGIRVFIKKYPA